MNYAYCCYKGKNYKKSIEISNWILSEIEDDNFKILFRLGMAYYDDGQFKESLEIFKRASGCVKENSNEFKDTKKKINSCLKKIKGKDNEIRKKITEAIKRDDTKSGEEIEMESSRSDEFERIKLLGEGNFSVKSIFF